MRLNNWFLVLILAILRHETRGLRGVRLEVRPLAVQRGGSVTLQCLYELEGAPLYAVKFYRGTHEFYRHTPSELPANKIFPYPGIYVDESGSNATQVTLRKVSFALAGNFSCEVTTDAPSFSTAFVTEHLSVISLPESKPLLHTDRDVYFPGDILHANCTSPPAKPPAELMFYINGEPIEPTAKLHHDAAFMDITPPVRLEWSEAWLSAPLQDAYFAAPETNSVHAHALRVTCTARVPVVSYRESSSRQVAARIGEPVHQRVMSDTSTASRIHCCWLIILFICTKYIFSKLILRDL